MQSTLSITLIVCVLVQTLSLAAFGTPSSGTLLVVNKKGDNLSFIDIASKSLLKNVATGQGPHELAITKDGKWAVTTDYVGGNSLTVFDVAKAKAVRTISLKDYPRPHGILFFKDQQHVAVSSEGSNSVVIANIHSGEVVSAIDTTQNGSHMVAMPGASDTIFTTNMADASVSVLSAADAKLIKLIPMPETPEAITVNKAGTELWVGSNHQGLVSIFDSATNEMLKQWQGYTFPYRILLSEDQKYAVVPDFRQSTIDIFDAVKKQKLQRIKLSADDGPKGVFFAPDDRTLFVSLYNKDKVLAISIPSGQILFSLPTGAGPDGVGYSPFVLSINE